MLNDAAEYLQVCTQLPLVYDPYGLLNGIAVDLPAPTTAQ
jgi:hypothetical protein